jgi:hypothetical protein
MEQLFARPRAQMRMHDGPLGGYIDAFIDSLAAKGYSRDSRRRSAWLVGDFSRWLDRRGIAAAAVNQGVRSMPSCAAVSVVARRGSKTALRCCGCYAHLVSEGVLCMPSPERTPTAAEQIEAEYVDYMRHERNLAPATIRSNEDRGKEPVDVPLRRWAFDVRQPLRRGTSWPLSIETVDLDGPRAGEVLVEIKATGICHTDAFTLSGADPEGLFPAILGHEGAGVVVEVGPGVTSAEARRPRHPAVHARMPRVRVLPEPQDQPLPGDPQHPGPGPDARRHQPLLDRRQALLHYMGTSTFANYTVVPEIALAKIREDAPFDKVCYIGCGVTTGIGAVINTAKVEPGANVVVFGLGGIGLNVIQGARMVGANMIVGVDINPASARWREVRHDPLRQPEGGRGRPGALPGQTSPRAAPTTASSASATPR